MRVLLMYTYFTYAWSTRRTCTLLTRVTNFFTRILSTRVMYYFARILSCACTLLFYSRAHTARVLIAEGTVEGRRVCWLKVWGRYQEVNQE